MGDAPEQPFCALQLIIPPDRTAITRAIVHSFEKGQPSPPPKGLNIRRHTSTSLAVRMVGSLRSLLETGDRLSAQQKSAHAKTRWEAIPTSVPNVGQIVDDADQK